MSGDLEGARNPGGSHPVSSADSAASALAAFRRTRGDHVSRARFAYGLRPGARVLDFGCGPGLAALLRPPTIRSYLGVELDPAPLAWANRAVATPDGTVAFWSLDEYTQRAPQEQFDLILLLEVIEHVHRPRELVERLLPSLVPGGALVLSTPNGALSHGDPELYESPFHVAEYDGGQLGRLLDGLGSARACFRQYRLDRMDVVARRMKEWTRRRSPYPATPTPGGPIRRSRLFQIWERTPQPASLWRIRSTALLRPEDRGCSHFVVELQR